MANKIMETINKIGNSFLPTNRPGGNVLQQNAFDANGNYKPVLDQLSVKAMEPYGTKIPKKILDRASGWSQLQNVSQNFTIEKLQAAFRAAERGDVTLLFGYYRDFFIGCGMVASELSKRKLSTLSEPYTVLPADKRNPDDVMAAEVIKELLDKCPTFQESLVHAMNAIVFPVSVLEKTFEPIDESYGVNKYNLRYKIKQLYEVDYNLLTYRLPYLPQGPINIGNQPAMPVAPLMQNLTGRPEDTIWDPDSWEPNLRFWSVFQNGLINYSYACMMAPDPNRHIVYRCNLLEGIARENFGALGKSILWWAMMSQLGADVFLRCLQKYGVPFVVAKVDTSQVDTVNQIMEAFGNLNIVSAMVVNKDAIVEIQEINYSGASEAHSRFLEFCNDQISLLISGQTLSSHARNTGLGSSVGNLHAAVREDIIHWDRICLNNMLKNQLFRQLLDINGIPGAVPTIIWGSSNSETDNVSLSTTIYNLYQAGLEPTQDSLEELSIKFGFKVQKIIGQPKTGEAGNPIINTEEIDNKQPNEKPDSDKVPNKVESLNQPVTQTDVVKQTLLQAKLGNKGEGIQIN